jgi:hypothetical protein
LRKVREFNAYWSGASAAAERFCYRLDEFVWQPDFPDNIAVASTTVIDIPVSAGMNQNSEEIGRVAVETLISLIDSNDRGKPTIPRRILVEGYLDQRRFPAR